MADERFRVGAEVTDGFTGPLGKMQGALRGVQAAGNQAGTALKKDFEGAHGAIGKTTGALQQMTPVLTSFGVGAFGAVASLTGMASALKNFTSNTQALSIMSRETGISIDKLRAFGELGERFGVSTSTMQGAVKSLSSNMYELRRRWGEAYSSLQKMNLGGLAEQLVSAPNMDEALKRAMEGLGKIPDPEVRRRVSRMLFGTDDIAGVAGELGNQFESVLADIARRMGRTTEQQVAQAKQFEKSLSELRANLDGLRHEALTPLVTELNEMVKALQSPEAMNAFNDLLGKIGDTARTTKQEFEAIVVAWGKVKTFFGGDPSQNREFTPGLNGGTLGPKGPLDATKLQGRESSIRQQIELLDRNPGAADYARKRDRMTEELKRVGDELQHLRETGNTATASPSSFQGGGLGGLIQKAGYGGAPMLWGGGSGGGALGGRGFGQPGSGPPAFGFPGGSSASSSHGGGAPGVTGGALPGGASALGGNSGQMSARKPDGDGIYRPHYSVGDADLDQRVINTIAGEVSTKNSAGVDAVINNMMNRVGSKGWGPSRNLLEVARARGQYAGYRRANPDETEFVRSRIRAIASGGVPDNTDGSNSYRSEAYYNQTRGRGRGYWAGRAKIGPNVGGNRYAFEAGTANGPYAPYAEPHAGATASGSSQDAEARQSTLSGALRGGTAGATPNVGAMVMDRLYGDRGGGQMQTQNHRLTIEVPPGIKAKPSMGEMFKDVQVSKSSQTSGTDI